MSSYYDDPNKPVTPLQPANSSGFMDYIKNHKMGVLIGLIILIGLIWWFCFRKKNNVDATVTSTGSTTYAIPGTGSKYSVSRTSGNFGTQQMI